MRLSSRLQQIGLTAEEVRRTPPRHAALRDDPAALALRYFRDRLPLTTDEKSALFAEAHVPALLAAQSLRLEIIEKLYLFSDWPSDHPDTVLPPGETTAILYRAARSTCDRALDLGCGSGTLALLLSPHARRIVGTDINPRAIALARLNAEINGIENVDFREGSLYNPVVGETFDLIVSQPPFIPLPPGASRHIFLHGGERGDELARQIIAGLADHLTLRGTAFVFSDWPMRDGEQLRDRAAVANLCTTLLASPPVTLESYAQAYGTELQQHLSRTGICGVQQCLAKFQHGSGVTERQVLPHEWSNVAAIL